jgi:hypothetical protein
MITLDYKIIYVFHSNGGHFLLISLSVRCEWIIQVYRTVTNAYIFFKLDGEHIGNCRTVCCLVHKTSVLAAGLLENEVLSWHGFNTFLRRRSGRGLVDKCRSVV